MKAALFAFNGEPMCFVHVLLNALDMQAKGHEAVVVIEGSATALVRTFHDDPRAPFAPMYRKAKDAGLIAGVCKACAAKMESLDAAVAEGLTLLDDMSGHPSMTAFIDRGYQVYTF